MNFMNWSVILYTVILKTLLGDVNIPLASTQNL